MSSKDTISQTNLIFSNCKSIYQNEAEVGAFAVLDNVDISLLIQNCYIYQMNAKNRSGLLDIINANKVTLL